MRTYLVLSWVLLLIGIVLVANDARSQGKFLFAANPIIYVGAGDVVPGAFGWWGLRAYTASVTGTAAADIIRENDSTTCTGIQTLSSGALDVSLGTSYCGGGQTVTNFCNGQTCKITKLYDQTGAGHHLTQSTDSARPILTLTSVGFSPGSATLSATNNTQLASGSFTVNLPYTMVVGGRRTANGGFTDGIIGGSATLFMGGTATANQWRSQIDGVNNINQSSLVDGNYHVLITTADGSPNQIFYADKNPSVPGANTGGSWGMMSCGFVPGIGGATGDVLECGLWNFAFAASQSSAMISNIDAFYNMGF